MQDIRWGIIGPGRIAKEFAESIKLLPNAKIGAVGSRNMERAQEFANTYGGKAYNSYEEMVQDPNVDMVYVATPHPMHEEHVILAANAGKAILCEKPFAVTYQAAKNMVDAAKKNNVLLMEGLWSRFFPVWREVVQLIEDDAIGDVQVIQSEMNWGRRRGQAIDPTNRLYDPALAGGGLLDAGAYPLSAIFMLMKGKVPTEIHSVSHLCETGVDDELAALFRYEDPDVIAILRSGMRSPGNDTRIIGSDGIINVERHRDPDTYTIRTYGKTYMTSKEEKVRHGYRSFGFQYVAEAAMEAFSQGLKECPITPLQQTLDIARISEDLRHKAGVWYPFEEKKD